jgi:hypothetical protein
MVKAQTKLRDRDQLRENPVLVACQHRLRFAFNHDNEVPLEALHLLMVCAGESLSGWAGGVAAATATCSAARAATLTTNTRSRG